MRNDIHRLRVTIGEKRLSKLIDTVQKHIDECPGVDASCIEELENFKKQAEYMGMYAFSEKKDPFRQKVFDNMVQGLQRLSNDVIKCTRVELSHELRSMKKRAPEENFELPSVRHNLEDFVSSVAMASITGENENDIIAKHFDYMQRLFDYIVTGRLWNESKKKFFTELISSPVIDGNDAQVLVSAITISALLVSDEYKIETLLDIYTSAENTDVKERALVGWVLALHAVGVMCDDALLDKVITLVKDPSVIGDLLELQMQLFYCAEAEKDTDKIQRDIMPGIVNNSNFKLNRFGIVDKDEENMKDILGGSGDADKAMEDIEKSMDKIKEMQKSGADIYFGGFAKMKRFSFFMPMINWFYPYFHKHPGLHSVADKLNGTRLLEQIVGNCPFCSSDKYSFALSMASIYDQLPDEIKNVLASEEMFKFEMSDSSTGTPSYQRRMYLQDLYRFYKLNDSAKYMDDPFKEQNGLMRGFFFDDYFLLCDELVQAKQSLARFFMKRRPNGEELNLLFDSYESDDVNDKLTRASFLMQSEDTSGIKKALEIYRELYSLNQYKGAVLHGLTRCLSHLEQYEEACVYSTMLAEKYPEKANYQLNHAIILIKCDRAGEANNILFKLNYEHPEDRNVMRVLAWCLLMEDKKEKSIEMFEKVLSSGNVTAVDNLNMGFAKWISNKEYEAADYFAKYAASENLHKLTHEIDDERELLKKHDILEVDMCMMLDLVEQRTK